MTCIQVVNAFQFVAYCVIKLNMLCVHHVYSCTGVCILDLNDLIQERIRTGS